MHTILNSIAGVLSGLVLAVSSFFAPHASVQDLSSLRLDVSHLQSTVAQVQQDQIAADGARLLGGTNPIPTPVALFETSLAAGITSTATSFTLVSAVDKEGNNLASSTYPFIIDEGSASEEMVIADCTATACTNVARGISVLTGTTSVTTLKKSHRRGASVKITDGPQLVLLTRIVNGIGTFPNKISYTSAPTFSNGLDIVDKTYVDGVAVAGAPNADETTKGISELSTAAETGAGTSVGSTGARLVIPTSLATSTPTASCSAFCVVVAAAGKISQSFLDLTASWTFSGGLTATATTTLAGSNVNSNAFVINTVKYAWPSSQGAASTYAKNDGSGNISWSALTSTSLLYASTSPGSMTGVTASTTIISFTVPANTLSTGNSIFCQFVGGTGARTLTASTIWLDISYGGTASTTVAVTQASGSAKGTTPISFALTATGATNSQKLTLNPFIAETIATIFAFSSSVNLAVDSTQNQKIYVVTNTDNNGSQFIPTQFLCTVLK